VARVVVIGAGVGGLAAAARLAAAGHRVAVHERAPTHGGKLGEYRRDGFAFDTGPSLLTMPHVFTELFEATGGPPAGLELVRVDPACEYRFADGTRLDMPHDPAAVPAAVEAALGPDAARAWRALHARSGRLWELVGDAVLRRPVRGVDLLRFSTQVRGLALIAPWLSMRGLGRAVLPDPRLRSWLDRYATYSGSDPRRAPSVLSVTSYVEQRFGAWHVAGGLRRLGDAMLQRCAALGVSVHLRSDVTAVRTAGGRVTGVELAGGAVDAADVVVCDADASVLYERLLRGVPRAGRERRALRRAVPSASAFVLLLALDGRERGRAAHRVSFPADYDAEFDALFGAHPVPVPEPAVYVHAPDDPALRPDDASEGWFVLVNAPPHASDGRAGTVDWTRPGLAQSYADHVLDVLARRGEDVRGRIRWREIRTPADLERETAAPGGSIYGSASHGARAALLRPANASPVRGLYLVGGSTHPGGGLPLVVQSAGIVADLVGPA
jgi:phytoene desaturase